MQTVPRSVMSPVAEEHTAVPLGYALIHLSLRLSLRLRRINA